jgi:PAS domain S-box-containing protein
MTSPRLTRKRSRKRWLRSLRRHGWMLALVPAVIGTLALTAGVIRRDAARGDHLRQAEIAAATAPSAAQGVLGAPQGLLAGQPVTQPEYALSARLRGQLARRVAELVSLWPTPASRDAAAEAHVLNQRTIRLMALLGANRRHQANLLYDSAIAPQGDDLLGELQRIVASLSQQSADARQAASDDASLIVGLAAAALLLLVIPLVFADRRSAQHVGERRELEQSQQRWRALFTHLQEILILVEAGGRISYTSPSIERWLGYRPAELEGHELASIDDPDSDELSRALGLAGPTQFASVKHRVRAKDGSWHTLESTLVDLRDDPAVGAVLIAAQDVTERVMLERERERLELDRRVSQRLEAVGQLSAGIAHEINTPLQFVGDSISFLKDAVEEVLMLIGLYRETLYLDAPVPVAKRRAMMREAEEQADVEYLCERIPVAFDRTMDGISRVRSIVQAMKRFSHASSTEIAPADINEAIETTLAVCRNEYKYVANLVLDLGDLPPVECNVSELNQVLLNLIINAAQAIEEQVGTSGAQGEIRISTRIEQAAVVIEIADTGPGIPAELLDRIYEPFFTTKEVGKGTGQGLALARTTIERHSGVLECSSTVGAGTTFTIRLPLARETADALAQAA